MSSWFGALTKRNKSYVNTSNDSLTAKRASKQPMDRQCTVCIHFTERLFMPWDGEGENTQDFITLLRMVNCIINYLFWGFSIQNL